MATLHLVLDENDRMTKIQNMKGVHTITLHLDNFEFSDEEILQYSQAAAMMLLGAVQQVPPKPVIAADAN